MCRPWSTKAPPLPSSMLAQLAKEIKHPPEVVARRSQGKPRRQSQIRPPSERDWSPPTSFAGRSAGWRKEKGPAQVRRSVGSESLGKVTGSCVNMAIRPQPCSFAVGSADRGCGGLRDHPRHDDVVAASDASNEAGFERDADLASHTLPRLARTR